MYTFTHTHTHTHTYTQTHAGLDPPYQQPQQHARARADKEGGTSFDRLLFKGTLGLKPPPQTVKSPPLPGTNVCVFVCVCVCLSLSPPLSLAHARIHTHDNSRSSLRHVQCHVQTTVVVSGPFLKKFQSKDFINI
jgi:hypothetical protein